MRLSQLHIGIILALFSALVALPGLLPAQSLRFSIPQARSITTNDSAKLVVTLGHTHSVSSAAFSPDGRFVVTGGLEDHVAILWEAASGREIRRFVGHSSSINTVAFSPDGLFVLTGSGESPDFVKENASSKDDYSARLWDVTTGKEIKRFEGHAKRINAVLFALDGGSIVTGSEDHTIRIWGISTGKELRRLTLSERPVSALAISPDGKLFLVGTGTRNYEDHEQCDAYLIDDHYRLIHTLHGHRRTIGSVSFSPNGKLIATSTIKVDVARELFDDNAEQELAVYQWDVASGKRLGTFKGFGPVAFSRDSHWILTAGAEDAEDSFAGIQVRDANTGRELRLIKGSLDEDEGEAEVTLMSRAPNGDRILLGYDYFSSGGNDPRLDVHPQPRILILDLTSGKLVTKLERVGIEIENLAFSKNGRTFLAGGLLWSVAKRNPEVLLTDDQDSLGGEALSDDGTLACFAVTAPGGNQTESEESIEEAYIWNDRAPTKLEFATNEAYSKRFSPDNNFLITEGIGDKGIEIKCHNVGNGKLRWTRNIPFFFARLYLAHLSVDFSFSTLSPDGTVVYILPVRDNTNGTNKMSYGTLLAVSVETGKMMRQYKAPFVGAFGKFAKVSPDGKHIIYPSGEDSSENSTTSLISLDLNTGRVVTLFRQPDEFYAVYSPDGKLVITAALDRNNNELLFLRADTGTIVRRVRFAGDPPLTFSDNGKYLLALAANAAVLWDLQASTVVRTFAHSGVEAGGFILDGHFVVTGGVDGTTRIWEVETGRELCRLVALADGKWVAIAPDGRFDTNNLDDTRGLYWLMSDASLTPLPLEIFTRDYYEPQLMPRLLKCSELNDCDREFKPVRDLSKLNRVQPEVKISNVTVPDAEGYVQVTVEVGVGEGKYLVNGKETTRASGVYDVRLFRDGQMVGSRPGDGAQKLQHLESGEGLTGKQDFVRELQDWRLATEVKPDKGVKVDSKTRMMTLPPIRVKLPQSKDASQIEFTAYAFNEDRIKSETARWQWPEELKGKLPKAHPVKPRAYVIAVGVNAYENPDFDLEFAADDARRMSQVISQQLKTGGQYGEVIPVTLVSDYQTKDCQKVTTIKQATKDNFRAVLEVLSGNNNERALLDGIENANQLQKATPDDMVLIMYSSHGYADAAGNFYFIPYDTGLGTGKMFTESIRQHSISSEELSLWLRDVDAGEMVMIVDACHSAAAIAGQDFKPGPMGSRGLGQLSYDKGMRILTATQSDNVAWEYPTLKQGVLTYALLRDGIEARQADHNKDKTITLKEWLEYGVARVPKLYQEVLTNSVQTFRLPAPSQPNLVVTDNKCGTAAGRKELLEVLIGQPKSRAAQQPSLFDFTRKQPEVVLSR